MKLLELRFKNLNSLYGEWLIDFTADEYIADGIFALTGPTGAGKSTILDAICLALYGETPRLGKITKSANEIISRQTGECYAEVLFESQAGRFRCHWEQRRARKKVDGKLQDQEHQIWEADSGKLLETKKSLVCGVIEEKTGMDFDRFTRSILLAQGGFDTFLRADSEQKSRILEQITGTEIYSEISCRVHERQREEREKLDLLRAEISGISILAPEQEEEIQTDLVVKQLLEGETSEKAALLSKAITWLTTIAELKQALMTLAEEAVELEGDVSAFKPEQDQLDQANKAAKLDGVYATLSAIRKQQLEDQQSLGTEESALPDLEASVNTQAERLASAAQQVIQAKSELKHSLPLIQKIRLLDQRLVEKRKALAEGRQGYARDEEKIEVDKRARLKEQERRAVAEESRAQINRYLEEHARDEWLVGGLAGVEEQLANLLVIQKERAQKEQGLAEAETLLEMQTERLAACEKQSGIQRQAVKEASEALQQSVDTYEALLGERLLREYRAEKESLLREMAFLSRIAELEVHRAKLEDGKPCPLCGAKEHPFAEGNVPVPDELEERIEALSELIDKAEELEATKQKLQQAENRASQKLAESEKAQASATQDKKAAEERAAALKLALITLRERCDEQKRQALDKLQPLGITEIADDPTLVLQALENRLHKWKTKLEEKSEIENQISKINTELQRLDAVIETQSTSLEEKRQALARLEEEYAASHDERKSTYGDMNPDDEERRLNQAITDAEKSETSERALSAQFQQKLISAKAHVTALQKRIEQRTPELKSAEADFLGDLNPLGFVDEKHFLESRLSVEQREELSLRAQQLEARRADLNARREDRESRLANEQAKKLSDQSLDELSPQHEACEAALKNLREEIAALKHKLHENTQAKERIQQKQSAIDAQRKEAQRWEKLHALIGSADGKKYRNFAQGLTFELMVSHANRQLAKMTDRYLLIRDERKPLELNVVDGYQAGEIRSTRNLSGGESFIVSLTLALGLSKMASRKVRVDSLFLDEGFGTLDDEALETALETLAGLQQEGKLIGVISHVSALKERIATRIAVTPVSGGKSRIDGPGCEQVRHNHSMAITADAL